MPTIVSITNTYPDREATVTVTVDSPQLPLGVVAPDTPASALEDWWNDVVSPHTGDGNGEHQRAMYTATVMSSDVPGLVGRTNVWDG